MLPEPNTVAATTNVFSINALQAAVNGAAPGDIIVLANGTYLDTTLDIGTSGITVRSATPGGVFLNGAVAITLSGHRIQFSGFQFTSGTITGIPIQVTGSGNLLTQLNFDGYSAQKYINIIAPSQSNEVAYCNFRNKPASAPPGNLVHVGADAVVVGYHKIRYCSFLDMPGAGGDNGNECIRLSNGAQSEYIARTVVEYCYFNNTGPGDSEAVSVKCRENVIRYCTFTNNPDAMLVFRNGNDSVAYGNFFIGAGGIRVKEANNIFCFNNYFERSGAGGTMNAVTYVYISPNLNNINFLHNTFVECGMIDFDTGATGNTWANNIFKKSSGNIFTGSAGGITWAGNIRSGSLGISIPSGMTNLNPQLELNSNGYYGLASTSPAIDAGSTNYPPIPDIALLDDDSSLLLDISGQSRPASAMLKDVGCDEYGVNGTLNRPLGLSDVGPVYLGGPPVVTPPTIIAQPQGQTINAGATATLFVVATNALPLSYQWWKDGVMLPGATATNYTIAQAKYADGGDYTVVVSNAGSGVTSAVAKLTVNAAPAITTQPQSQTVIAGSPVTLLVAATNTTPLSYQWRKDGTNLPGATATNFTVPSAQFSSAGAYSAVVTNIAGSVTSSIAVLTVVAPASVVLLDDQWLDGTRTNTLLPTDAAWHASFAPSLTVATNSLTGLADSASARNWWTYFTTNAAAPVQLAVSETLQVTLNFRLAGVNANNTTRGLRIGIFNSSNGVRTLTDGAAPNGANIAGYMLGLNMGQVFGGSPTAELWVRTNLPSGNLMGTTGDFVSLGSGGPGAGNAGFSNGLPYTLRLTLKRTTNSLDLAATITTTNGWSLALTASPATNLVTSFDTFALRPTTSVQSATNFIFTELKVEKLVAAVPPAITNQPASLSVEAGGSASFAVAASGGAPLAYQWRFNGASLPGATAMNYSVAPAQTTNAGNYTVVVSNAAGSVTSAVASLAILVKPPELIRAALGLDGDFTVAGVGPTGEVYGVLATTNLAVPLSNWPRIATGVFTGGVFSFTDKETTNYARRFYHILTP